MLWTAKSAEKDNDEAGAPELTKSEAGKADLNRTHLSPCLGPREAFCFSVDDARFSRKDCFPRNYYVSAHHQASCLQSGESRSSARRQRGRSTARRTTLCFPSAGIAVPVLNENKGFDTWTSLMQRDQHGACVGTLRTLRRGQLIDRIDRIELIAMIASHGRGYRSGPRVQFKTLPASLGGSGSHNSGPSDEATCRQSATHQVADTDELLYDDELHVQVPTSLYRLKQCGLTSFCKRLLDLRGWESENVDGGISPVLVLGQRTCLQMVRACDNEVDVLPIVMLCHSLMQSTWAQQVVATSFRGPIQSVRDVNRRPF